MKEIAQSVPKDLLQLYDKFREIFIQLGAILKAQIKKE